MVLGNALVCLSLTSRMCLWGNDTVLLLSAKTQYCSRENQLPGFWRPLPSAACQAWYGFLLFHETMSRRTSFTAPTSSTPSPKTPLRSLSRLHTHRLLCLDGTAPHRTPSKTSRVHQRLAARQHRDRKANPPRPHPLRARRRRKAEINFLAELILHHPLSTTRPHTHTHVNALLPPSNLKLCYKYSRLKLGRFAWAIIRRSGTTPEIEKCWTEDLRRTRRRVNS
ncbi:hypothetical protein LZ32DRAFT_118273 [Colletotrichum eremochloae]|nr:hypothetical protein LZ32DRAFT_118273 [Colletotrichum eremochloae]